MLCHSRIFGLSERALAHGGPAITGDRVTTDSPAITSGCAITGG